jgi:hypothetical protein
LSRLAKKRAINYQHALVEMNRQQQKRRKQVRLAGKEFRKMENVGGSKEKKGAQQ